MGRKKLSSAAKIRNYFAKNPHATPAECIAALGVKPANVYLERSKMKAKATRVSADKLTFVSVSASDNPVPTPAPIPAPTPAPDMVNNPPHYTTGGIETIDFIEAKKLPYCLGNAVKYITRAQHKGNYVEDLKKAVWYLEREIERNAVSD